MNPSTYELLAGIQPAPGIEVVVLPNSPNVILAAERAAELSEKPASVVPTTAPQEGLAALLAFDPARPSAEQRHWRCEARRTRCGSAGSRPRRATTRRVASPRATRWATPAASWWRGGSPAATLAATLDRIVDGAEPVTCIAGEKPPARPARRRGAHAEGRGGRVPRWRPARLVVAPLRRVTPGAAAIIGIQCRFASHPTRT